MRLAWFSPLPPVRPGISRYSAELLESLVDAHAIDVYVDTVEATVPDGVRALRNAHEFPWRRRERAYDLVVYQMGNAPCHDYIWPYLVRYPGLVALHDGLLHHARGRALLQRGHRAAYRAEFHFNHPDAHPDIAELGIAGLLDSLTYLWPMRRVAVVASRLLLVHEAWLAEQIRAEQLGTRVEVVEMGVPDLAARPDARAAVRNRHRIPSEAVVFAAYGKVTPEKRLSAALEAMATLASLDVRTHVLLCGEAVNHYDVQAEAARFGIGDRVTITGYLDDAELPDYLSAADVCLCLRWPSARETSAFWLRCLAAGKPTVITDLVHLTHVPALDPRDWQTAGLPGGRDADGRDTEPACVAIDILDEVHSLKLAVRRLATDAGLRLRLGQAARRLWERRYTLDRMRTGYARVLAAAAEQPAAPAALPDLPTHLRHDGMEYAAALVAPFDLPPTRFDLRQGG